MTAALDGLTLLDFSRDMAGSYAAMLLAEQGADCIKIEAPVRSRELYPPAFALFNRSKRSLTLDPERPEGRDVLARLLVKADILIQDFGVERTERLGLDYATLSGPYPRLIYCGITAYGEKGPLNARLDGEAVVAAYGGTVGGQGGYGQPPVFVLLPFGGYATAMLTAYGASLALFAREITGRGQKVETSLLAGTLAMEAGAFLSSPTIVPITVMRSVQQGVAAAYRLYQCQDDWIMIACGNPTFWNKFCLAIEQVELLSDPRFVNMPWGLIDVNDRLALTEILAGVLKQKPRKEWLEIFLAADVPCAAVHTREQFMDDPQVQHNHMIVEVDDRYYGRMRQMNVPLTLTNYPAAIKWPAPGCGEHTWRILEEAGYSRVEIEALQKKRAV